MENSIGSFIEAYRGVPHGYEPLFFRPRKGRHCAYSGRDPSFPELTTSKTAFTHSFVGANVAHIRHETRLKPTLASQP